MSETWTINSVREAIAAKKTSAREIAAEYYRRIAAWNGKLNAYLTLCEGRAYAQAGRIDALVAAGQPLPPLAGVPIAIKDVISTREVRTTCGSKILSNYVPPYDATAVLRLETAGAVILGKTNCDEFAMGSSNENSAYGPVQNPAAPGCVPGGSSGGSAAVVAADLAVAALGTDTGGSIRQPGAFCGIPAMMGSYGRVSRYGLIAFASSLDRIGPFARTVADTAKVLQIIAGRDPQDSTSTTAPVEDYSAALDKRVKGLRLGISTQYFGKGMNAGVREKIAAGIELYKKLGCEILDIEMPHTDYAIATYYIIATAEASANLARFDDAAGRDLVHRDGGGEFESGAIRRRALRATGGWRHADGNVPQDAGRRIRFRGEAKDRTGNVRALGGVLRRLLFEGTESASADCA